MRTAHRIAIARSLLTFCVATGTDTSDLLQMNPGTKPYQIVPAISVNWQWAQGSDGFRYFV